jgi:hypothetical protein
MELKTQALDRLLEALSPAISSEIDRITQETRETLEQEFKHRMQAAVQEAQAAAQAVTQTELERAVAEATEATRTQVKADMEEEFKQRLAETTGQLQAQAAASRSQLREEFEVERAQLQEQLEQWKTFAEAYRQLVESSSQPEILSRFLRLSQPFAAGLAVYVAKADGLALWKSRGNVAFPEIISQQTTDPESYFRSIHVRGRTVAAVSAVTPFKSDALDFLTGALERAIEMYGLRLRSPIAINS